MDCFALLAMTINPRMSLLFATKFTAVIPHKRSAMPDPITTGRVCEEIIEQRLSNKREGVWVPASGATGWLRALMRGGRDRMHQCKKARGPSFRGDAQHRARIHPGLPSGASRK
jgi:hypothetical protein